MIAPDQPLFNTTPLHTPIGEQMEIMKPVSYACRIGFIGAPIDRFDRALLGRVLAQRRFEKNSPDISSDDKAAAQHLLLRHPMLNERPTDRNYFLTAQLTGCEPALRRQQLKLAIDWLLLKRVEIIFCQYIWMQIPEMQNMLEHYLPLQPMLEVA